MKNHEQIAFEERMREAREKRIAFGARMREAREKLRMSRVRVGIELGVTDQTVSNWETGRHYPDIALLGSLSRLLGVSVQFLFTGKEFSPVSVSV